MRAAFVVALAACAAPQAQPETIRRPVEDKAAIAPPPPAPEVLIPGEDTPSETPSGDEGKLTLDEALNPPTNLELAEPTGAPPSAKLTGSVLVWIDAPFYLAPKDSAPSIKLATLGARKTSVGQAVPMRVVSSKGAFVEVETPITDSLDNNVTDCAWFGMGTQYDIGRWRLFVRRADLAPVVTKRFAKTFADGSRVEVEPGQPIVPLADGKVAIALHSIWVPVAMPASSIGYAYPMPGPPVEPGAVAAPYEPKHILHARTVGIADTTQPVRGAFRPRADSIETKGDVVGFPLSDTCGKATVVVKPSDVRPYESKPAGDGVGGGIGFGMGTVMGVERWFIPKGTRLVAHDGAASTTVTRDISVEKPAAGAKQVCVERNPFVRSTYVFGPKLQTLDADVKLCVAARSVKHEKAKKGLGFGSGKGGGYGIGGGRGGMKPPGKK